MTDHDKLAILKFIVGLGLYIVGVGVGYLVMIYGWGIQPQNWWIIIGGSLVIRTILGMVEALVKK